MRTEYFENLDTYENLEAHKQAVLNNADQEDRLLIQKAIDIVEKYHNTERTLYAGNYNRHPVRVARILIEELGLKSTNAILIALCHDLGEWTDYKIQLLEHEFNSKVKEGVEILTWKKNDTWDIFFKKIVDTGNIDLIKIKIADKLDNNRSAAFSGSIEEKKKMKEKTELILLPFLEKNFPEYLSKFKKSLLALA